jgi:hypothetical protein
MLANSRPGKTGLAPVTARGSIDPTLTVSVCLAFLLVGSLVLSTGKVCAQDNRQSESKDGKDIDTEFLFGFTEGADVGELGERELEHETIAAIGKRNGSYAAIIDQLQYEHLPIENFRFEIGAPIAAHFITGVAGLDDRQQVAFDGLFMQMRYKLIDREHAPFSLTVGVEPHWSPR